MNSRPLVPLSDDPRDALALTPAHFLVRRGLIALPEPENLTNTPVNRLVRWELVQRMNQLIWDRWHREYLTSLIDRTKWKTQTRNFQIDDLVLIKEDSMPPSKWHMGRVIQILPSKDGIVRAIKLKTRTGEYIRPILKLALLLEGPEDDSSSTINPLRPTTEQINPNLRTLYNKMARD